MTMPSESLSFRCRPSPWVMLLCGLFFGAGTAVLAWKAQTNDRGLILNGLIEFSQNGATIFYWVLAVVSALFVVTAAWTIFTTLVHGVPDVTLSNESISFPVGFPVKRAMTLPLSQIENLSRAEVNGQRFLMLHSAGKKHHISLNWLESKEAGQRLEEELRRRLS